MGEQAAEVAALETAFINFARAYAQHKGLGVRMSGKRAAEVFSHRSSWWLRLRLVLADDGSWSVWTLNGTGYNEPVEWPGSSALTARELTVALQFVRTIWKGGSYL